MLVQHGLEFGVQERVDFMLEHHRFIAQGGDLGVDLRAFGTRCEKRRIVGLELMAYMHDQLFFGPGRGKNPDNVVSGLICTGQGPFAAWEVVVLDVDNDQRVFAHFNRLLRGSGCGVVIVIGLSGALADWRERQIGGKN
ncbi:hypothetical protein D3C75_1009540 [compost metagenome]